MQGGFVAEAARKANIADGKRVAAEAALAGAGAQRRFSSQFEARAGGCIGCAGANCAACTGAKEENNVLRLSRLGQPFESRADMDGAAGILEVGRGAKREEAGDARNNSQILLSPLLAEEQRKRKRRELEKSNKPEDRKRLEALKEEILRRQTELEEVLRKQHEILEAKKKNLETALSDLECSFAMRQIFGCKQA